MLDWRTKKVDDVQQQLAWEVQHQNVLQKSVNELDTHLQETRNTQLNNEDDIAVAQHLTAYLHTLTLEKHKRLHHLERQKHVVKQAQGQLHAAYKDKQVLEKLKERQLNVYKSEEKAQDLATMEELAMRQFANSSNPLR